MTTLLSEAPAARPVVGGLRIGREPAAAPAPTSAPSSATAGGSESWLSQWINADTIERRLSMINELSNKRLPSHLAAEVWLQLQGRVADRLAPDDQERLSRQFLMLAPEHPRSCAIYRELMDLPHPSETRTGLMFMITSCTRYMAQAERVLADLLARGADARVVIGEPGLKVAVEDGHLVRLPVSDTYEALLSKVLEGLTYLRRRFGPVAVAKIDDDMRLSRRFDPAELARMAHTMDYVGHALGDHPPDRCWHLGKTSVPTPIFTRRHRGRFAYGPLYLLGPRAVEHLVREWVFYPDEFAGEIYEDRAVGDALRRAGIDLRPVSFADMGGVVDETERPLLPATPRT